jgi:hypothetical protein
MTHSEIRAAHLTTFDIAQDGSYVRLHMQSAEGGPATVVLPLESLNQLLMTLPKMVQMALQRSHADDSLRLVHALKDSNWRLAKDTMRRNNLFLRCTQQAALQRHSRRA